jgi:formate dehydrogenase
MTLMPSLAFADTQKVASVFRRSFQSSTHVNEKVLAVLYPDPLTGFPPKYAREGIPTIKRYPDGMLTPNPKAIDFKPGELLGCVSGELGLRKFLEEQGHQLVVTADKDGEGCEFEKHLEDAHYIISQPFYPAYLTKRRMENGS